MLPDLASENPERAGPSRPGFITVILVLMALLAAGIVAFLVKDFGYLMLLVVPAGVLFIISIGKPEYTLYAFIFVIYTQLTTVLREHYSFPSPAALLVGLLIVLMGIRFFLYNERPYGWLFAGPILFVYVLSWLVSLLNAGDFAVAYNRFTSLIQNSFGALIVVFFVQRPTTLRRVIWVLIGTGFIMGTIVAFQHLTGTYSNSYWGFGNIEASVTGDTNQHRAMGPYANPNAFAQIVLVIVPLAIDRFWNERSLLLRFMAAWTAVACILTIFFTYSRGGLLSMLFGIGILVISRRPNIIPLALTGLLALGLIQFLPAAYADRLGALTQFLPSQHDTTSQLSDISFRGRLSENTAAWQMFLDNPILGVGLDNFKLHYQDYSRNIGLDNRRDQRTPASLYLELLSEQGIVGTFIFLALIFVIFRGLLKARKQFEQAGFQDSAYIATALFAGLCGYMFAAINKNSAYPNVFWMLIGIALATIQVAENVSFQRSQQVSEGGDFVA